MGLNRVDLINQVAKVVEIPKQQAKDIVQAILDSIARSIERGEQVEIRGFGGQPVCLVRSRYHRLSR